MNWDNYWQHIIYWPLLVIITGVILFFLWRIFDKENQPFYGFKTKDINWKPYLLMLLIMLPLVTAASTQQDFLAVYPKIKSIAGVYNEKGIHWWHNFLFELSYGSDFITIELFFRGFLVLAFIKWAGKDAILPMACFYCTIHFGKPLGECISSYFGGMLLGIVVYNTRSILGGLIVHLGIAWMMEVGGYLGNTFIK
jgi:membrane protease YdiL (CAAX protease family)